MQYLHIRQGYTSILLIRSWINQAEVSHLIDEGVNEGAALHRDWDVN
jgi:hypothetical protein